MDNSISDPFWIGVNYWPARSGVYWWQNFDKSALAEDFERIQEARLRIVRVFLLWEDFQPGARKISTPCLDHLVDVAEEAGHRDLSVMPTLFTGHMCGVNWIPPWALWAKEGNRPHPVFSQGKMRRNLPRNFYEDPEIIEAQALLVREVSGALQGHTAVWAWDLGNSPSSVVTPPGKDTASLWLRVMTEELRSRDENIPVTLAMTEKNLWEDPFLGPRDTANYLDFISVQAYPYGSPLSSGPEDALLPPFLGVLARWLGAKDVLVSGLGVPTEPDPRPAWVWKRPEPERPVREEAAGAFFQSALDRLREAGMMGALVSFFSDFAPVLWEDPPLNEAILDRHMGAYRSDGSPKEFLPVLSEQSSLSRQSSPGEPPSWIDISQEEYDSDPKLHIGRLYDNYRDYHSG